MESLLYPNSSLDTQVMSKDLKNNIELELSTNRSRKIRK